MQSELPLEDAKPVRGISPYRELGAYEALWLHEGASFRSMARTFRSRPGAVPSDFVAPDEAEARAEEAVAACVRAGVEHFGVRVHGAGEYPAVLRDAKDPVELLYFRGWWDLASSPCVAVVGTRKPSEEGVRRTRKLARRLVEAKFTVVSGLAAGVDTAAHEAAIAAGGATIAVVGTPITDVYPRGNAGLQEQIAREHLLVSQIPILRYAQQNFRINRFFFPERNITMSALTRATVIVEAGETSGTLTQARAVLNQGRGRKLFILDSCFGKPGITWPENFLGKGAIRVRDFDEILQHLGLP